MSYQFQPQQTAFVS